MTQIKLPDDFPYDQYGRRRVGRLRLAWGVLQFLAPAIRRTLGWIAVAMLVGTALSYVMFAVLEPWAYSLTFGPTLTGRWYGELTPPAGGAQVVYFEMWVSGGDMFDQIRGRARVCGGHDGVIRDFDLDGDPGNWRGTSFRFRTAPADDNAREGWQLRKVTGTRDGDTIRATATLRFDTIRSRGDSDDPHAPVVPFTAQRGREADFLAACSRLQGR